MEKQVKLKLISYIYDLQEDITGSDKDRAERIEASVRGRLNVADGKLTLSYREPVEQSLDSTVTTITFDLAVPERVTLTREGGVNHQFIFDCSAPRRTYLYETPLLAMEMSVFTRGVVNRLTDAGGTLHLDYTIDVRGSGLSRTVIDLMAREVDA